MALDVHEELGRDELDALMVEVLGEGPLVTAVLACVLAGRVPGGDGDVPIQRP